MKRTKKLYDFTILVLSFQNNIYPEIKRNKVRESIFCYSYVLPLTQ